MIRFLLYISLFFFMNYQFAFCQEEKKAIDFDRTDNDFSQTITEASENGFVVIPPHPGAKVTLLPSKKFRVTANGLPVPVRNASVTSDAWFFFSGVVEIKVFFHEMINSYEISPKSLPANVKVKGNVIIVKLDSPRKFIIHGVNGDKEVLAVLADSPPLNIPDLSLSNIKNINKTIRSQKLNEIAMATSHDELVDLDLSTEIQSAIDGLSKGDILCFPPGVYPVSSIKLKSDMELYLFPGSILYSVCGTREINGIQKSMIDGREAENTSIRGHGTIMANGHIYSGGGAKGVRRQMPTTMRGGDNRLFADFMLREQQFFSISASFTKNTVVRNIKILTSLDGMNRDGFGINSSQDLLVEDIFVYSGDDAIVINLPEESVGYDYRIIVRNNILWNQDSGGGIKIGYFWSKGVRNLVFENIDIITAPRSLTFFFQNNDHDVSDIVFKNIRCERTWAKPGATDLLMDLKMGSVKNARFVNFHVMHQSPFDITTNREIDMLFNGFFRYPDGISKPPVKVFAPEIGMPSDGIKFSDDPYSVIGIKSLRPAISSKGKYEVFKIYRTGDLSTSLTIPYSIRSNAIQDEHYKALKGSVKLEAGVAEAIISIEFLDKAFEGEHKSLLISPDYIPNDYVMMGPDYHAFVAILAKN